MMRRGNEQGSASALFLVACWTLILMGLVMGADFGRLYLYREQVRTAADAAALAGALQARPMVKATVQRWREATRWVPDGKGKLVPEQVIVPAPDFVRSGLYPINIGSACIGYSSCEEPVWECWLQPGTTSLPGGSQPGSWSQVESAARYAFQRNAEGTDWAPYVKSFVVTKPMPPADPRAGQWRWFDVRVQVEVEVPTLLWSALGKQSMVVSQDGLGYVDAKARLIVQPSPDDPYNLPAMCGGM